EYILEKDPRQLAVLIKSDALHSSELTFAAEIMGRCGDSNLVRQTVGPLLRHAAAVVREGAIYGLVRHLDDDLLAELSNLKSNDPSAGVRTAAGDALCR